jgi:glycosyltransferase involved in cell wall biosynthesis
VLSKANLILVPHEFLRVELSALGLRVDGLIPNFIELEKYTFRERSRLAPRFLYLRGMHSIYNPAMAVRALALIQQQYPEASLTMAGREDTDSDLCRALVRDLQVRNVHFIGQVAKEQIPALADQHDIHLHTNRVENMPVSIIEMWACGLPIVGTRVGGMPYLVRHRVDGILVASEDYRAMAEACFELLSDSELARTLSQNGSARAQELTWESIEPAWARVLALDEDVV